ncbi:hypothetical protein MW887_002479 [Aspergillus wentii]|nr:hypothetical protein MW887_002479 [Aspergillus wentii]
MGGIYGELRLFRRVVFDEGHFVKTIATNAIFFPRGVCRVLGPASFAVAYPHRHAVESSHINTILSPHQTSSMKTIEHIDSRIQTVIGLFANVNI